MSAWTRRSSDGQAARKIVPPRLRIPCWKGPGAESEEKREPVSDIDTAVVDSLKALDPDGRLEKRTSERFPRYVRFVPNRSKRNTWVALDQSSALACSVSGRIAIAGGLAHQFADEIGGDHEQQHGIDSAQPHLAEPMAGTNADRRSDQDGRHHRGEDRQV